MATSTECYDFLRLLFARVGWWPSSRWYALLPVSAPPPKLALMRTWVHVDVRPGGEN